MKKKAGPKVEHVCTEEKCTRTVSGQGRRCNACNAARMRAAKAEKGSGVPAAKSTGVAAPPDNSWWVGSDSQFSANYQQRLPKFLVAGVGRDSAAIGSSLTTV